MAATVVEVFQDASVASGAAAALLNEGFRRDAVCVVSGEREPQIRRGTAAGAGAAPEVMWLQAAPSLIADLVRLGIPERDAIVYSGRVAGGAALVLVRAEAEEAKRAALVLERAQAVRAEPVEVETETAGGAVEERERITPEPEIREILNYSVVAVFEDPFSGERAMEKLAEAGIARSAMQLISRENRYDFGRFGGALGLGVAPETPAAEEEKSDRRFMAEMGRLGVSEEDAKWYWRQAAEHYVLAVGTEEEVLAERAAEIIEGVQQRVREEAQRQWREPPAVVRAEPALVRGPEGPRGAGRVLMITIGAFEGEKEADRARAELLERGFPRAHLYLFSPGREDQAARELARLGLPEEDARRAVQVHEGKYLVAVRSDQRERALDAAAILDRMGGTEARRAGPAELQEEAERFGRDLAMSSGFEGRKWHEAAPEAERFWDERHPGTWPESAASVRRGYLSASAPPARPTACVVGSFVSAEQAEHAITELLREGFRRDRIRVASRENAEAQLVELGLPREAARRHVEESREDGRLVAVLATEEETSKAARILRGSLEEAGEEHRETGPVSPAPAPGGSGPRSATEAAAMQYGREIANARIYEGRAWEQVEFDIRGYWESRYPGTWERNREAIRRGFMEGREFAYEAAPRTGFWHRLVHNRR